MMNNKIKYKNLKQLTEEKQMADEKNQSILSKCKRDNEQLRQQIEAERSKIQEPSTNQFKYDEEEDEIAYIRQLQKKVPSPEIRSKSRDEELKNVTQLLKENTEENSNLKLELNKHENEIHLLRKEIESGAEDVAAKQAKIDLLEGIKGENDIKIGKLEGYIQTLEAQLRSMSSKNICNHTLGIK
jgi:chromosome segregation ATPase